MNSWQATALNTAPDSENQIHSDELAKEYGFKGGLVQVLLFQHIYSIQL